MLIYKRKIVSILLVFLFLTSAFSVATIIPNIASSITADPNDMTSRILSEDQPNKMIPKSMLVYTEFADHSTSSNGELRNTYTILNEYFLNDYHMTNLTDYTELSSVISDYDVFLIAEQELLYPENITDIGTAWTTPLTNFVTQGGVIVLLDCYSVNGVGAGPGLKILNATGLISVVNPSYMITASMTVTENNNALASTMPNTFTGLDGIVGFETTDCIPIVNETTSTVVAYKAMEKGHIALLGFDLFTYNDDQKELLRNAVQLCRHVVVDQSHSPFDTIQGELFNVTKLLVEQGYAVSSMPTFSPVTLTGCDLLILLVCSHDYNTTEVGYIDSFVDNGGGLFIITEFGQYGEELDPVTDHFGFVRNKSSSYLTDTDDTLAGDSYIFYNTSNFQSHSIMVDVARVEFDRSGGFESIPANGIPLVKTDTDGTSFWNDGTPADGLVIAAAAAFGIGRVAVMSDINMYSPTSDPDIDAVVNLFDSDNEIFLFNFIQWCSSGGEEEKFVLFDETHDPDWFVNASYYGFAQFLTENGYTVRWMSGTWNPSLIESCDVLIIHGYVKIVAPTEITDVLDFVSAGGGLFVLGGYNYDNVTNQVLDAFGMEFNATAAIDDTNDNIGPSQCVFYNSSNFGTHPIMGGVTRLEISAASALLNIAGGTPLVTTDTDGTAQYTDGTPANGLPLAAALEHELGRIVAVGDRYMVKYNSDHDSDGVNDLYDSDNDIFIRNAFRWLSENRAPVIDLLTPSGGGTLEGMLDITWTAVDPNKDPMTFSVFYSDTGGPDWVLLDDGITASNFVWDTTTVDDGVNYLILVVAYDDKMASDEDGTPSVFTIDNHGPDISHIAIGTWPTPESPIPLTVNATDISGVDSVLCNYTTNGGSTWTVVSMALDSGDTYSVDLGPFANGTIVEYILAANDTLGHWTTLALEEVVVAMPASTTSTTSTTTTTDTNTGTTTPPPGDTTLIIIIAAIAGILAIIVIVVLMKRKK